MILICPVTIFVTTDVFVLVFVLVNEVLKLPIYARPPEVAVGVEATMT